MRLKLTKYYRETTPKNEFSKYFQETFNEQLKFYYGISSCFVIIILLFCCKITYCILAEDGENLITAPPQISAQIW